MPKQPKNAARDHVANIIAAKTSRARVFPSEVAEIVREAVKARDKGVSISKRDLVEYLEQKVKFKISQDTLDAWCRTNLNRKSFTTP